MSQFIPVYQPDLSGNELKYVIDCIKSNWISSLGKYVEAFESRFAEYCGVKHAIAVCNGTTGLHLALLLRDIGPGDEVIVPALSFVATANAVVYTGAQPVFVDCHPGTWTLDPLQVEAKITPRTRAIIPVHLYGHPADMKAIMDIADRYDLYVVEDAAEAHGAECYGKKVGAWGHVGVFSFYGNKIITTGEGGMLTTDDDDLAEKARFLKDHGMSKEKRYWHPIVGYNYRMTNVQAAIGLAQLERIDQILQRKLEIASLYRNGLDGCPGVTLHPQADWAKNVYWMYSVLVEDEFPVSRDGLAKVLKEKGIDTRPFFYPLPMLPPYGIDDRFPVAEHLHHTGINLPSFPNLTSEQIEYICNVIWSIAQ